MSQASVINRAYIPQQVSSYAQSYYLPEAVACGLSNLLPAVTMNITENQGPMPAATLAPNFVYQSVHPDGTPTLCFTETLGAGSVVDSACSGANSVVAFSQRSAVGTDALTRGLLSQLTPILPGGNDSVFRY